MSNMPDEVVAIDTGTVTTASVTEGTVEKRTQVITWFLGIGFLMMICAYGMLAMYAMLRPTDVQGAWQIVQGAQKDMKEIMLIVVGILGGAVTQRHQ